MATRVPGLSQAPVAIAVAARIAQADARSTRRPPRLLIPIVPTIAIVASNPLTRMAGDRTEIYRGIEA
jgi:hypothetical protein